VAEHEDAAFKGVAVAASCSAPRLAISLSAVSMLTPRADEPGAAAGGAPPAACDILCSSVVLPEPACWPEAAATASALLPGGTLVLCKDAPGSAACADWAEPSQGIHAAARG